MPKLLLALAVLSSSLVFAAPTLSREEEAFYHHKAVTKEFGESRDGILKTIEAMMSRTDEFKNTEEQAYGAFAGHTKLFGHLLIVVKEKTDKALPARDRAEGMKVAFRVVERAAVLFDSFVLRINSDQIPAAKELFEALLEGFPGETSREPLIKTLERAEAMIIAMQKNSSGDIHPLVRKANEEAILIIRADKDKDDKKYTPWQRYWGIDQYLKEVVKTATLKGVYAQIVEASVQGRIPTSWRNEKSHAWVTRVSFSEPDKEKRGLVLQVAKEGQPYLLDWITNEKDVAALEDLQEKNPRAFAAKLEERYAAMIKEGAVVASYRADMSKNSWTYRLDSTPLVGLSKPPVYMGSRYDVSMRITPRGRAAFRVRISSLHQNQDDKTKKVTWEDAKLSEVEMWVTDPR